MRLLNRQIGDPDNFSDRRETGFRSLFFGMLRLDLGGELFDDKSYGGFLDGLVSRLDQMSERRVVPGRIYSPTTIHGRQDLLLPYSVLLLVTAPKTGDDGVISRIEKLANEEPKLPKGDRSLHDIAEFIRQMSDMISSTGDFAGHAVKAMSPDTVFNEAKANLSHIFSGVAKVIKARRDQLISERPIDPDLIKPIRDVAEAAITTPPASIPVFEGFLISCEKTFTEGQRSIISFNKLPKGVFTRPPMVWNWSGLNENLINGIKDGAANLLWGDFLGRSRKTVQIESELSDAATWLEIAPLQADVGQFAALLLQHNEDIRQVIEWSYLPDKRPAGLEFIVKSGRKQQGDRYLATVNGLDVYSSPTTDGHALLFSRTALKTITYMPTTSGGDLLDFVFVPQEDPWSVRLEVYFSRRIHWDTTSIFEIQWS